jgi:nitrogen regulatory protein PII
MRHFIFFIFLFITTQLQAQFLKDIKKAVTGSGNGEASFTQQEAGKAIIEALEKGAIKGVSQVSQLDGYLGNAQIKIPFPPEVQMVETKLRAIGMDKLVDDAVTSINRAAEDAAVEAKVIFVSSIKQLTFKDAIEIIRGEENAATGYLQKTTTDSLTTRFRPIIESSLEKVNATKYWDDVMSRYNKIPFTQKVNEDLTAYATEKAIEGLFVMIAKEELKIREDPIARTTDILKKVFGGGKE